VGDQTIWRNLAAGQREPVSPPPHIPPPHLWGGGGGVSQEINADKYTRRTFQMSGSVNLALINLFKDANSIRGDI
jgi:hypothetical protein